MNLKDIIEIMKRYEKRATDEVGNVALAGVEHTDYKSVAKEIKELFNKRFSEGFTAGMKSVRRRNASGCCCTFSDDDTEIVKLCGAHEDYYENLTRLKK